jgi:hypothetical protein
MNTNKETAINLLDVRILLSALWVSRMLSGLQGDSIRLHDPVALKGIIEGTGNVVITNDLLLVMSMIFMVPILMSFLSLTVRYPAIRRANLIIGMFFALFDLIFLCLALFVWQSTAYEILWSMMYLVFTASVVRYAWKWMNPES